MCRRWSRRCARTRSAAVRAAARGRSAGRRPRRWSRRGRTRRRSCRASTPSASALATALRTEKADAVREAAALALGDLGARRAAPWAALAQALKDKHPGTVKAAAQALRRMGKDARDAQARAAGAAGGQEGRRRGADRRGAVLLGQVRPDVTQALPVMREALADEKADDRVRKAVAEALGKLGKDGADASPTLAAVLVAKETASRSCGWRR